jgi:hypothetical protein
MAGIAEPTTIHGLRHTFHDVARQQGVPDAVAKAMAGRARVVVAQQRSNDKHLHCSPGVTLEEMRQASIAVMSVVATRPAGGANSRNAGRGQAR